MNFYLFVIIFKEKMMDLTHEQWRPGKCFDIFLNQQRVSKITIPIIQSIFNLYKQTCLHSIF